MQYDWPGNVRELENCINRALTLGDRKLIDENDLAPALLGGSVSANAQSAAVAEDEKFSTMALEELERLTIQRVFDKVSGNKAKAGELLGISRATLYRKLKRYQIPSNLPTEKIPN
jgi:DNA-binding NtrC family response regulator